MLGVFPNLVSCPYCQKSGLKSSKGLNTHISRTRKCRLARFRLLATQSADKEARRNSPTRTGGPDSSSPGSMRENGETADMDVDKDRRPSDWTMDDYFGGTQSDSEDPRQSDTEIRSSDDPLAGVFQRYRHPHAARTYGPSKQTQWEELRDAMDQHRPFHPWASRDEFELVEWLSTSKLSQRAIDRFLKLNVVTVSSHI